MKLQVFSVFDTKVGSYAQPFYCRTRGEAVRSFEDACRDDKLPFRNHPGDYRLYHLCEFDDGTGQFTAGTPTPLMGADELGELPRSS